MPIEKWSDLVAVVRLGDDPQFSEDMEGAANLQSPCVNCVLDFSAVHGVTSTNIGALLQFRRRIQDQNGRLVLCGVLDPVRKAFLVTGLDKLFDVSDSVATALATLQLKS
jgi:anti-anti-sigma factor